MRLISIEQIKVLLESGDLELQPTQKKLCLPIIQRIYHKMNIGVPFDNISVSGYLLINGHHRYICSLLLKKSSGKNDWICPSKVVVYNWSEIQIDIEDWESIEIIERHNVKDAATSGLDIRAFKI